MVFAPHAVVISRPFLSTLLWTSCMYLKILIIGSYVWPMCIVTACLAKEKLKIFALNVASPAMSAIVLQIWGRRSTTLFYAIDLFWTSFNPQYCHCRLCSTEKQCSQANPNWGERTQTSAWNVISMNYWYPMHWIFSNDWGWFEIWNKVSTVVVV